MAQSLVIPGTVEEAKIRTPIAVWLWNIPTLGIYRYFWWYYINNEMRNLGKSKGTDSLGTSPVASLFALIFGFLIVPLIWTIVTTTRRVQRAQVNIRNRSHERLGRRTAAGLYARHRL